MPVSARYGFILPERLCPKPMARKRLCLTERSEALRSFPPCFAGGSRKKRDRSVGVPGQEVPCARREHIRKGRIGMDFLELAKRRYSVREYTDKQVEQEKLDRILKAAQVAPTAANRQPVHMLVVQSREGLDKIGKAANLHGATSAILVCADRDKAWTRSHDGKKSTDIDASIVTDHMMLEATDLGVGSLWICSFKPDVLREEFALPENLEVINILALGYAACEPADPERHGERRVPVEELVSYEKL